MTESNAEALPISPEKLVRSRAEKKQLKNEYFATRKTQEDLFNMAGADTSKPEARKPISIATAREFRTKQKIIQTEQALQNALIDPRTGLDTSRMLNIRLNEVTAEQKRQLQAITRRQVRNTAGERKKAEAIIVMADLLGLGAINDTYGHDAGNIVLSVVGAILRKNTRNRDFKIRYGGDEFTLLLRGTDKKGARTLWNNINRALLQWNTTAYNMNGIRISAGFAQIDPNNPQESLKKADAAMYKAKKRYYDTGSIENNLEDADSLTQAELTNPDYNKRRT